MDTDLRERETAIQRQIYRRVIDFEFLTDSGIRIPLNLKELERRITDDYPYWTGLSEKLLDPNNAVPTHPEAKVPGAMKLSEMPNPENSIVLIHRNIVGSDYQSPELYGLPIPIDRQQWEARHIPILRKYGLKITIPWDSPRA